MTVSYVEPVHVERNGVTVAPPTLSLSLPNAIAMPLSRRTNPAARLVSELNF